MEQEARGTAVHHQKDNEIGCTTLLLHFFLLQFNHFFYITIDVSARYTSPCDMLRGGHPVADPCWVRYKSELYRTGVCTMYIKEVPQCTWNRQLIELVFRLPTISDHQSNTWGALSPFFHASVFHSHAVLRWFLHTYMSDCTFLTIEDETIDERLPIQDFQWIVHQKVGHLSNGGDNVSYNWALNNEF